MGSYAEFRPSSVGFVLATVPLHSLRVSYMLARKKSAAPHAM